jgi:hypothetical protein
MRWLGLTLLFALLSGCVAEGESPLPDPEFASADDETDGNVTGPDERPDVGGNGTVGNDTVASTVATLIANVTNGTAPLAVNFTIDGSGFGGDEGTGDGSTNGTGNGTASNSTGVSWTLDFGDGNQTNGTSLPAMANHTYSTVGNYSATLTITSENGTANSTVQITVEPGAGGAPAGPNHCHRPGATAAGPVYVISENGDWTFAETNGVPGLQVENNHPGMGLPAVGGFWVNDAWVGCEDGDQNVT